ncbi:NAD-glutamate dehydrogenase [Desulforhopalus vacuolatus]|uniref:NAD-glutamate dehydrogenase domain-containing protein n=1 Tax=Desulforhopalus vacuolatus TaxID=40414 RepID=UPI001966BDF6|nr:NAD-glutamate dehydrogenase domain-containing protein [Desulforhopalus vacuolatus]MBM9519217.1 NAD-glutamate dehydrogenase [Desulforhopalus vacuolatus]
MTTPPAVSTVPSLPGAEIIKRATCAELDLSLLYEAVMDITSQGMVTTSSVNMAAGILLKELGLPTYFFRHIHKDSLVELLTAIASDIQITERKPVLRGQVAPIDFNTSTSTSLSVRIATAKTRDSMEFFIEKLISGHRREYYFSPDSEYYTYIINPGTIGDFPAENFEQTSFLFSREAEDDVTPATTRKRYEKFLQRQTKEATPLIQFFNLPETDETRIMFNSDFERPQIPSLRKILEDHGSTLVRAYWEPYFTTTIDASSSICSLYIRGELSREEEEIITRALRNFLSLPITPLIQLYLSDDLSFEEMIFATNAVEFTHRFIFKETENATDRQILEELVNKDHRDAFARRIHESNRSTYSASIIRQVASQNPDLLRDLFGLFDRRFNPASITSLSDEEIVKIKADWEKKIETRFIDQVISGDIFRFMFKMITCCLKTNFYCETKRSFSFRYNNEILDPLVFDSFVYGIFLINGHYSSGTHLRAGDIARGGLRLLRITPSNFSRELDGALLLNYALGAKAQRIKHKDICESGAKGVVVPYPPYARCSMDALFDYTEGILDLMLLDEREVVDYYGKPEMIFFGPDEGTAPLMDPIAERAKERGYKYWRTLTTGKSIGIPHDVYGLLEDGRTFGLFPHEKEGTELQIDGKSIVLSNNMEDIAKEIGDRVNTSGMTTTSVMSSFRTVIKYGKAKEEDLNLAITGGPDGDLGSNEILSYKGKICLIIDGGSILYDPSGLDSRELQKLAFFRSSSPRLNSLAFPVEKLSAEGFMVPLRDKNITLPDGTLVEDGAVFHRNFLTSPASRKYIEAANIEAMIPCGGFKDTINLGNIAAFLANFDELRFIVEGANVFFSDGARRHIRAESSILHIKDSSANKGGVFSSSIAEVLTAFLLGNDYDKMLLNNKENRWHLVRDVMTLVARYSSQEASMLLALGEKDPTTPLSVFSVSSSECIFALQDKLEENIKTILKQKNLVEAALTDYIPPVLIEMIGMKNILNTLDTPELRTYRNTILTKKLAAMAYYRFAVDWDTFLARFDKDMITALESAVK